MRTVCLALLTLTTACSGADCDRAPWIDGEASEMPWGTEQLVCPGDVRLFYEPGSESHVELKRVGLRAPEATLLPAYGPPEELRFGLDGVAEADLQGFCGDFVTQPEPTNDRVDWLELHVPEGARPARVEIRGGTGAVCL